MRSKISRSLCAILAAQTFLYYPLAARTGAGTAFAQPGGAPTPTPQSGVLTPEEDRELTELEELVARYGEAAQAHQARLKIILRREYADRQRDLEHRQPVPVATDDLPRLVWRPPRRNPDNPVQSQRLAQRASDGEVPVVNRVEGSPEDSDSPGSVLAGHDVPMADCAVTVASGKSACKRSITTSST